jgi:DNA-directed RNA polymerase subunit RPC12/RpoP
MTAIVTNPPATPTRGREFEVTLPIGYTDAEGKLHRTVVMRKMTGKEEAILTDKKFQRNGGKLVTELLHSCVQKLGDLSTNGRTVISELYSVDRNYLLLKLRSITFGSELKTSYTCPACSEAIHLVEDLDALPVNVLNIGDELEDVVVELEDGYLDRDGQVYTALTLRLPRGSDEEAVASQMRQNASQGKNALLARCLKSLGDLPRHRLEALGPHIMTELTMTDRRAIDQAMNIAAPGVDLSRELECPHCGHLFKATLDLSNFLALD